MWGQGYSYPRLSPAKRIIPTRVGTRKTPAVSPSASEDHPHACGDKFQREFPDVKSAGSSPRVWGQGHEYYRFCTRFRIIPTRVGTSLGIVSPPFKVRDHPHACGDKMFRNTSFGSKIGSSPRVWGQVDVSKVNENILEDHPHACGDKTLRPRSVISRRGSSPRVWGQVWLSPFGAEGGGIIPTRVGTRLL